jgi:2-polyprenyl-6-methoxyphenol hydroxylase-like FAD-dependent oxidoreductase
MRIVVVGGSIAGLAAAIALRNTNPDADLLVLERRTEMDDEGAGLALRPEAIEGLRSLGITLDGTPIRGWRYAAVTAERDRVAVRAEWSAPLVGYTYAAVRSALLARASGIEIRMGAHVTTFEDVEADLVVAADGIDSLARRTLFANDVRPEPTGIVMGRGFLREDEARAVLGADVLEQFLDVTTQLFASPDSSTKGWWLASLIPERTHGAGRRLVWVCYARTEDDSAASVRAWLDASFPAPIAALAAVGTMSTQRIAKLLVPSMTRGRVCLIGDAAHVVPPFTTAGATLAVGDAIALAHALATQSLETWSAQRLAAAGAVHAQADLLTRGTIDHAPDLAAAAPDELAAWARTFLPPPALRTFDVIDRPLWAIPR